MIDSHCHLADPQFAGDLDRVFLRAEEHGVEAMITIADNIDEGKKCLDLAEKYDQSSSSSDYDGPRLFCTIGVHPHHAGNWSAESGKQVRAMALSSQKVKAIGEIGLDYHYDRAPRDVQQAVLREQLQIAKDLSLPAVIHNRESFDDLWRIVREVDPPKVVLHCCTEEWGTVQPWVERGYLLSFTGIATYPKSEAIRETIRHCPLSQMMIETDAPYLAPVPFRGRRNEPAFVVEVAKVIADIKGMTLYEVDRETSKNAVAFFGLHS